MDAERIPGWRRPNTLVLAVIFVATLPLVNPYVRGDGNGYYAYVRSLVIDGDLDFENEFRRADPGFRPLIFDANGQVRAIRRTPEGRIINQWAVGPSMLWLPFFLAGHAFVGVVARFGVEWPADGYSAPYLVACGIGTALYAFLGLLISMRLAERLAGPTPALLATVGIWFGSSLPVYMYFLPFHVHALSAFVVALFIWYWVRTIEDRGPAQWAIWGAMGGLLVAVYQLNGALWIVAGVEALRQGIRAGKGHGARRVAVAAAAFGAGASLMLVPHGVLKTVLYGSPFETGYRDGFHWLDPRLWQVAFAPDHGLFVWTPVLLVALVGLALLARQTRVVATGLLLAFAGFYYVVASFQNWHGLSSFGNRFFVSFTPAFVIGLAVVLEESARWTARAMGAVNHSGDASLRGWIGQSACLAMVIAWNVGLIFQWGTNLVNNRGPVDLTVVARNQIVEVPKRLPSFLVQYFTARGTATYEIEQEDLVDQRGHVPHR